jgi:hypothetical protein
MQQARRKVGKVEADCLGPVQVRHWDLIPCAEEPCFKVKLVR